MDKEATFRFKFNDIEIKIVGNSVIITPQSPSSPDLVKVNNDEGDMPKDLPGNDKVEFADYLSRAGRPVGRIFILLSAYFFRRRGVQSFSTLDVESYYSLAGYLQRPRYLHVYMRRLVEDGFIEGAKKTDKTTTRKQYSLTAKGIQRAEFAISSQDRRTA